MYSQISQSESRSERIGIRLNEIPPSFDSVGEVAWPRLGWAHLRAIIDCHDRQCVGYEFALRGRAKEAERALEAACIAGFGTLYPHPEQAPQLRSENGLIFQSRRFRQACRAYRLKQEFITPSQPMR